MMRKLNIIFLLSILLSSYAQADNDDNKEVTLPNRPNDGWVLIKNDRTHNITTWARQEEGKRTKSFKVTAIFEGSLEDYLRMILDVDSYKRWYFEVTDSKLLKQTSPTEYLVYLVHNAPPGTPDRDAIIRLEFEPPTTSRPYLLGRQTSIPNYMPPQPPYVRVIAEDIILKIYSLSNNRVKVEAQGFVDPGGRDPAWIVNFFQRAAPYKTFLSMSRRLKQISGTSSEPLPFSLDKATPFAE